MAYEYVKVRLLVITARVIQLVMHWRRSGRRDREEREDKSIKER
jgi:hypothetical protein